MICMVEQAQARLAPKRRGRDLPKLETPKPPWERMEAGEEDAKLAALACHLMEHGFLAAARPSCASSKASLCPARAAWCCAVSSACLPTECQWRKGSRCPFCMCWLASPSAMVGKEHQQLSSPAAHVLMSAGHSMRFTSKLMCSHVGAHARHPAWFQAFADLHCSCYAGGGDDKVLASV